MKDIESPHFPKNQIFILDDVISDELCNTIKIILDESCTRPEEYGFGSNVKGEKMTVFELENKKFAEIIDKKIYEVVNLVASKIVFYNPHISLRIEGDSGYLLRKIKGATKFHQDGFLDDSSVKHDDLVCVNTLRTATVIIALNSDYEGGELCFPEQQFKIKLKKGQAIAFPPYWTHPHYTTPLLNDTVRYTINTWLTH